MKRFLQSVVCSALLAAAALAQDMPFHKVPSVTMEPPPVVSVTRGKVNSIDLQFRVGDGFHINSNKPTEEYLIPTTLKLEPPTDLVIGKITYPPGSAMSFPFAPDEKLSVYTGDFTLTVPVRPMSGVLPSKYELRGTLRYQACDNAQCYPPKNLAVQFAVKVVKAPVHHANPAQSPHAHN